MSGFEIAGIILATIPILTPIVQNTVRSLSTRRYDQQLQRLIRNLKTEQVNLQNVVERLLDGLVPASQIQAMINDPMGDLWRDPTTALRIRGRLWDRAALETFETTIQSIKDSVDDLRKKLQEHSSSNAMLTRARFQFSSYDKSLAEIKAGIASLILLTSESIKMEPSRKTRSQGPFLTFLQAASRSLHRAIQSGLPCQSQCHHGVGLRLKNRKSVLNPHGNEEEIMQGLEFELAISGTPATGNEGLSWREILVKSAPVTPAADPIPTESTTTTPTTEPPSRAPATTLSTCGLASQVPDTTLTVAETSMSLCKMISDCQQTSAGGILIDSPRRYTVLPLAIKRAGNAGRQSLISLREVLERNDSFFLSFRDRLQIAVAVSSSILQLHGSPWLSDEPLSSHDIYFFVDGDAKDQRNTELTVLREEPFLIRAKRPRSSGSSTSPCSTAGPPPPHPTHPLVSGITTSALSCNKTLFSLGCLLLELISNEREPEFVRCSPRAGVNGPGSAPLSQYIAAHKALVTYSLPSDNYRGAVSRCLQGGLHKPGRGLDTEDVCQEVYSGVVALLERDLENT
ncbi:hypothetical protein QBC34DRAFT_303606 [Podospora aff. communis PSN243]|uniref:DUF7580 domain-containing protein n=1 Tax=Podospora aff. communis PSN243 TaxID=3040156 RepID=A0AAV9GJL2_9PEZI|nr:hypothetical protein QBC34DRAFT_303606 [Podospora aff. communis PSN243]